MGLYIMRLTNEIGLEVKDQSFLKGQKLGSVLCFGEAAERGGSQPGCKVKWAGAGLQGLDFLAQ